VIAARVLLAAALLAGAPALAAAQQQPPPDPHAGHVHPSPPAAPPAAAPAEPAGLPSFIPPVTDADRAAAFPDVHGHTVHDDVIRAFVLADELEWRAGGDRDGAHWDLDGWIGKDVQRLWFRTEGISEGDRLDEAHAHVLYGHAFAPWWEVVAGIRQDFDPGSAQTWAAGGIQGFAPYRIDLEVTGYLGGDGRTQLRVDAANDLRLTRRLIAQSRVEATLNGKTDTERLLGAGLSSMEAGLRFRYEIRRELAPYAGVVWRSAFFETADLARAAGEDVAGFQLVVGLRVWR
jgi:copper resistance protein B